MRNEQVRAPFTLEQVARIREHQADEHRHPLTCCDHKIMEVTAIGLLCRKCGRIQNWVPACVAIDWPTPEIGVEKP